MAKLATTVCKAAPADLLIGGLGDVLLDGGDGDDVYYYSSGDGNDRVVDSAGSDWLACNDINWGQTIQALAGQRRESRRWQHGDSGCANGGWRKGREEMEADADCSGGFGGRRYSIFMRGGSHHECKKAGRPARQPRRLADLRPRTY